MKGLFFLFIISFILCGCGLDQGVNRSYIISHSKDSSLSQAETQQDE